MNSAQNRDAVIADDTFQIQDWLRSNGNHDRGYPEFDYHHRIRPLSPVKRYRISTTDGRVPDRRRQLKSMESLLGLSDENLNGKHLNSEAVTRASPDVQDSLDRALMDFEETLELAFQSNSIVPPPRGFSNHNFIEGDESNFNKLDSSFESSVTGSSGYSTKPDQSMHRSLNTYNELQLIREQMIKSLEIIKDLEEQVKLVPLLKAQVSSLNIEKQQLSSELDKHKKMENIYKNTTGTASGWSSSTLNRRAATAASTKEVGVNCVPVCRDVGIRTQATASSVSVSTSTSTERTSAEGLRETACTERCRRPPSVAAYTQTAAVGSPATSAASTQTTAATAAAAVTKPVATVDVNTQTTTTPTVRTVAVGVTVRPRTYDASVTVKPTLKHVGCTADVRATAVVPAAAPVTRTTQTETAATPAKHVRATQTAADSSTLINRTTQTAEDCETVVAAPKKQPDWQNGGRPSAAMGRRSNSFHHYTAASVADAATKDPASSSPAVTSKIPRLKSVTPELNRKVLTRQDTYTKAAAEICSDQPPRVADDGDGEDDD
ncbi:ice-structuring glycoprotein-like, partial [Sipha flava]|uniref:Ice-structuring glycoprotein-like n=2 Tax=Sipha flava TaxID=143950 RepID=A0A8B8G0M1_9HEMI